MEEPRPAPRPLVWAAAALAAGAWMAAPEVPRTWTALLALPGIAAFARSRGPRPGVLALALVAAVGAARAALPPSGPDPARPTVGRWEPSGPDRGRAGGGGRAPRALPDGAARAGELLRLLPPTVVRVPARAPGDPEPGLQDRVADHAPDEVERLAPPPYPGPVRRLADALSAEVRERLGRALAPRPGALARALLLGDASGLGAEPRDLFTRTGTRHLLAVSGLHVGLFALLALRPLLRALASALGGGERTVGVLLVLALLVYVPLSGGRAPVARAGLALALTFVGHLVGPPGGRGPARRPDGLSLLAAALVVECALDPRAPARATVQLSYGATAALLVATAPLARALGARGPSTGARLDAGWPRALATAIRRPVARALAASVAAGLGTLPVVWTRFGEWSAVGVLATPLCVPPLAAALVLGWATVLGLPGAAPGFELAADALVGLLGLLDRLPGTPSPLPPRPGGLLVGIALLALAALRDRRRRWAARGALLGTGLVLLPWTAGPRGLEVELLDVGHGTAVLARAPGAAWVLDGGSRDRYRLAAAMARRLAAWEVARPVYVLTHGHGDHASALPRLVERFPPRLWAGAAPAPLAERIPHGVPIVDVEEGRARLPSPGPVEAWLARGLRGSGNEGSRTLSLRTEAGWVHLTGDADTDGLAAVLDRGHLPGPTALLLVPHHGSDGGSSARLLDVLAPARAWVSAAREAPMELELARRGVPTQATWRDGPARWPGAGLPGTGRAARSGSARVDTAGPPASQGAGGGPGRPSATAESARKPPP